MYAAPTGTPNRGARLVIETVTASSVNASSVQKSTNVSGQGSRIPSAKSRTRPRVVHISVPPRTIHSRTSPVPMKMTARPFGPMPKAAMTSTKRVESADQTARKRMRLRRVRKRVIRGNTVDRMIVLREKNSQWNNPLYTR